MALNVNYKNRFGYYTQTYGDKSYKVWFCRANCTCAMMHFYRHEDEQGKTARYCTLAGFFGDLKHAERCIADDFFARCKGFTFLAKEMDKEMWGLVKLLTKHGIKVTIK